MKYTTEQHNPFHLLERVRDLTTRGYACTLNADERLRTFVILDNEHDNIRINCDMLTCLEIMRDANTHATRAPLFVVAHNEFTHND